MCYYCDIWDKVCMKDEQYPYWKDMSPGCMKHYGYCWSFLYIYSGKNVKDQINQIETKKNKPVEILINFLL